VLIKKHPEFAACLSEEAKLAVFLASAEESKKDALQKMFASFMSCDRKVSDHQLQLLLLRLQAEQSSIHPHPHDEPPVRALCCSSFSCLSPCHLDLLGLFLISQLVSSSSFISSGNANALAQSSVSHSSSPMMPVPWPLSSSTIS